MYIYEQKNWPKFNWDQEKIFTLLTPLRHKQGRLIGRMEAIGFPKQDEAILEALTNDVVKSSEIEGEILDQSLVRSSVARHLHMDIGALCPVDKNVDGVVEMVLDATQNYDQILTKERLFEWHLSLFPQGGKSFQPLTVGSFRKGVVEVVSGQVGDEKVHFQAPPACQVGREMDFFLDWINKKDQMDLVLKASIAHLWFVTIHPFDDGNGRIGRAIADFLLARSEKSSKRFYSLSKHIQLLRKGYYAILEKTQKGSLDITHWIEWFFHCLDKALDDALVSLEGVLQKAEFWKEFEEVSLNERQRKVVNRLLDGFKGKLTSSKWAKIAKCSQDTAYRDILELIDKDILEKDSEKSGRSTSYSLVNPNCSK